jgi:hypothetical protein
MLPRDVLLLSTNILRVCAAPNAFTGACKIFNGQFSVLRSSVVVTMAAAALVNEIFCFEENLCRPRGYVQTLLLAFYYHACGEVFVHMCMPPCFSIHLIYYEMLRETVQRW